MNAPKPAMPRLEVENRRLRDEGVKWAISALDSLGHDLSTGAETKGVIAQRAHKRAEQLRALLRELGDA